VPLQPPNPVDISILQNLEKAARIRYLGIAHLAFVAAAPPIGAERLQCGNLSLAEREGRIIGFVLTKMVDERLYIENISVLPEASGQGIGADLMRRALASTAGLGLKSVMLTTFLEPRWNARWFARFGLIATPAAEIGPGLRRILERQARSVDPATRTTLWLDVSNCAQCINR
jgi:N-acetylglutamate synthase-like GNAT family acetyltransferase